MPQNSWGRIVGRWALFLFTKRKLKVEEKSNYEGKNSSRERMTSWAHGRFGRDSGRFCGSIFFPKGLILLGQIGQTLIHHLELKRIFNKQKYGDMEGATDLLFPKATFYKKKGPWKPSMALHYVSLSASHRILFWKNIFLKKPNLIFQNFKKIRKRRHTCSTAICLYSWALVQGIL